MGGEGAGDRLEGDGGHDAAECGGGAEQLAAFTFSLARSRSDGTGVVTGPAPAGMHCLCGAPSALDAANLKGLLQPGRPGPARAHRARRR